MILVVIAHPFRDNIVEWFHRWSYVAGSVIVGWVIATNGRTRQAFRLFLAGSSIIAIMAMEHAVTSHFQPAQWGVYQKNGIGAIMWIAIVVAQINPSWTGIGRTEARINKYLCIGGLLASQSRQSVILLILAIALAAFLNPELRGKSKLLMLAVGPDGGGAVLQLRHQRQEQPPVQLGGHPGRPDLGRHPRLAPEPHPR